MRKVLLAVGAIMVLGSGALFFATLGIAGGYVQTVAACSAGGSNTNTAPTYTTSQQSTAPLQANAAGTPAPTPNQHSFTAGASSLSIAQQVVAEVKREQLPERAAIDTLAAGLAESGLSNDSGGDLDSAGFLQQRPSQGWGTDAQVTNVPYATEAFLHHLVELNNWPSLSVDVAVESVQRGAPAPDNTYGSWENVATQLANQFWRGTAAATSNPGAPPPGPVGSLGIYPPTDAKPAPIDPATPQGADAAASSNSTGGTPTETGPTPTGTCSYGTAANVTMSAVPNALSGAVGAIQREDVSNNCQGLTPVLPGVPPGGYPTAGFPCGQCTWWAAFNSVVTWSGNAADWWANSPASRHSSSPAPGDIVVYGSGGGYSEYGHVAIVLAVSSNSYTVSEANYQVVDGGPPPAVIDERVAKWPDPAVLGFIQPVAQASG